MGLDMYLEKRTYISNVWKRDGEELDLEIARGPEHIKQERIVGVSERVGYWRKANAIHAWFVQNVQNGEDDCGEYNVSREKLQELLEVVNRVLQASKLVNGIIQNGSQISPETNYEWVPIFEAGKLIENPAIAKELLPTQEGFFFGSTDYDEGYYQDLVDTKAILEEALADSHGDYYYQASW